MDTEKQQLEKLNSAIRTTMHLEQTLRVLQFAELPLDEDRTAGDSGSSARRQKKHAVVFVHHDDPNVIKLLIRRDPEALCLAVDGGSIVDSFRCLPSENHFCNRDEIFYLLADSYNEFREHRFPRLIELCGTSDALAALAAAHSEDDLPLIVLSLRNSCNKVLAHQAASYPGVDELFRLAKKKKKK